GNKDLLDFGSLRKLDNTLDELLGRNARAQLVGLVNPEPMELQVPSMSLSDAGRLGTFVHTDQNALAASKPAFSATGLDYCPPKAAMHDQHGRARNGKQQNGASRKILADLKGECHACENEKCHHPQGRDITGLQAPIRQ